MVFILGNGNVIAGEIHDLLGLSLVMTYRRHEYLWKYIVQWLIVGCKKVTPEGVGSLTSLELVCLSVEEDLYETKP